MTVGFAFALVLIILNLGRDGRWLPLYGFICALTVLSLNNGIMSVLTALVLVFFNFIAWIGLRGFSVSEVSGRAQQKKSILPVITILFMQLVVALSGANLGLGPTLGVGLVLAGLCSAAYGAPLSQFCGLLMAADGMLVMACVLASWGLCVAGVALWGVMAVLGTTLLPRLAWRRVEER